MILQKQSYIIEFIKKLIKLSKIVNNNVLHLRKKQF